MGRTSRSRRTSQSSSSPKNESEGNQDDWDVDVSDAEISIGYEAAGFGAEITVKSDTVELTLGIGIASVTLDLNEPNNSSISYVFDLYEIEGERDGCTVKLEYKIAGVVVKEETREIPECEEEEPEPEPEPEPPKPPGAPRSPTGKKPPNPKPSFPECIPDNATVSYYVSTSSETFTESNFVEYMTPGQMWWANPGVYQRTVRSNIAGFDYENREWLRQFVTTQIFTVTDVKNFLVDPEFVTARNFSTEGYGSSSAQIKSGIWANVKREVEALASVRESGNSKTINYWTDFPITTEPYEVISYSYTVITPTIIVINPPLDPACVAKKEAKKIPKRFPPPPRPKGKIMDDKCCLMVKQIWEVLRAEEILEKGYPIPNRLMAPGGQKERKPKDYPSILKCLIQMLDKGLIGDFTATIEDSDLSTPGNQPQSKTFPDATASQQEIVQFLMQNKADDAVLQDILIRQTILQAEIMEALMETQSIVKCLLVGLGLPYKGAVGSFRMPVDVDIDPDKPAEKNLTEFLQESEKQYEAVNADLTSETLWFYVTMAYLRNRSK